MRSTSGASEGAFEKGTIGQPSSPKDKVKNLNISDSEETVENVNSFATSSLKEIPYSDKSSIEDHQASLITPSEAEEEDPPMSSSQESIHLLEVAEEDPPMSSSQESIQLLEVAEEDPPMSSSQESIHLLEVAEEDPLMSGSQESIHLLEVAEEDPSMSSSQESIHLLEVADEINDIAQRSSIIHSSDGEIPLGLPVGLRPTKRGVEVDMAAFSSEPSVVRLSASDKIQPAAPEDLEVLRQLEKDLAEIENAYIAAQAGGKKVRLIDGRIQAVKANRSESSRAVDETHQFILAKLEMAQAAFPGAKKRAMERILEQIDGSKELLKSGLDPLPKKTMMKELISWDSALADLLILSSQFNSETKNIIQELADNLFSIIENREDVAGNKIPRETREQAQLNILAFAHAFIDSELVSIPTAGDRREALKEQFQRLADAALESPSKQVRQSGRLLQEKIGTAFQEGPKAMDIAELEVFALEVKKVPIQYQRLIEQFPRFAAALNSSDGETRAAAHELKDHLIDHILPSERENISLNHMNAEELESELAAQLNEMTGKINFTDYAGGSFNKEQIKYAETLWLTLHTQRQQGLQRLIILELLAQPNAKARSRFIEKLYKVSEIALKNGEFELALVIIGVTSDTSVARLKDPISRNAEKRKEALDAVFDGNSGVMTNLINAFRSMVAQGNTPSYSYVRLIAYVLAHDEIPDVVEKAGLVNLSKLQAFDQAQYVFAQSHHHKRELKPSSALSVTAQIAGMQNVNAFDDTAWEHSSKVKPAAV